jgi:myo-inositol 2-dehydrogenase/D-chiro-inositol 1-dehydrogenase
MLIHDFDMFRWLLDDEAVYVDASGVCAIDPAIGAAGDADTVVVTLRSRRGRLCQINASRRAAYGYDQRLELLGSKGMLQAGNPRPTEVCVADADGIHNDKPPYFFLERYQEAYRRELRHFIDALLDGSAPTPTLEDGIRALELAEAATISWQQGRRVLLG